MYTLCRVCIVPVNHDIHICIDGTEHGLNNETFALSRFTDNLCSMLLSRFLGLAAPIIASIAVLLLGAYGVVRAKHAAKRVES